MFTNNNATNRVGPTLTITSCVGSGRPSTRVFCVNAPSGLRTELMPRGGCTFCPVGITNFSEDLSIGKVMRGIGTIGLTMDSSTGTGGLLGRVGPSLIINANNCMDNPILGTTRSLGVGATVRRRGTFPNIAAGVLTPGTSHMVLTVNRTRGCLGLGGGPVIANGPVHRRLVGVSGRATHGVLGLSGEPLVLSFNNSLNTGRLGRTVTRLVG